MSILLFPYSRHLPKKKSAMKVLLGYLSLLGLCHLAQAVPKYYMDLNCGQQLQFEEQGLYEMRLYLTQKSTYQKNMHCSLTLNTTTGHRFMLHFKNFNVEYSSTCSRDWLDVRDGSSQNAPFVPGINRRLCGSVDNSYVYKTTGSALFLMFTSDNSIQNSGFQMVVTSYHTGECFGGEYGCDNGRCIDDSLTCNGQNPCGDHSDCPLSGGAIAGIVIGALIFGIVVTAFVMVVCRRHRRRRATPYGQVINTSSGYGASGYNQPVPQQYPSYPTGQQAPPPQNQSYPQPYPQQYPQN